MMNKELIKELETMLIGAGLKVEKSTEDLSVALFNVLTSNQQKTLINELKRQDLEKKWSTFFNAFRLPVNETMKQFEKNGFEYVLFEKGNVKAFAFRTVQNKTRKTMDEVIILIGTIDEMKAMTIDLMSLNALNSFGAPEIIKTRMIQPKKKTDLFYFKQDICFESKVSDSKMNELLNKLSMV